MRTVEEILIDINRIEKKHYDVSGILPENVDIFTIKESRILLRQSLFNLYRELRLTTKKHRENALLCE